MGPFELILDPTVISCQAQAKYGLILDLIAVFQILGGRLKSNVQYCVVFSATCRRHNRQTVDMSLGELPEACRGVETFPAKGAVWVKLVFY